MKGSRKRYPASFKARVALEAAKQTKTLAELSGRYQVHSVQISQWKKQLLDGIESLRERLTLTGDARDILAARDSVRQLLGISLLDA